MKLANNLGFIFFPGPKATSYLSVLKELQIIPSVIVVMENKYNKNATSELTSEYIKQNYFDLNYSLEQFSQQFTCKIIRSTATHINDQMLAKIIKKQQLDIWLFSGGGIIHSSLLKEKHRFLHIHPGQLPEVKGSTCFYYSLLQNNSLAASAFFMEQQLDAGEPLAISQFTINLDAKTLTPEFMDNIIDPWIRSQTLKKILQYWYAQTSQALIVRRPIVSCRSYYVVHPILRSLALLKVSNAYNIKQRKGVFEVVQ